jgi:hypothetical protein
MLIITDGIIYAKKAEWNGIEAEYLDTAAPDSGPT